MVREKTEQKEKQFLKKGLEWLRRQPKARGTKQKGRTDRALEVLSRKKAGQERKSFWIFQSRVKN